jgi:hypothetical protein
LLQQRLAAITDTAANLKAQLSELDELRERIRKAELVWRLPQVDRRIQRSMSRRAARQRSEAARIAGQLA